MKPEFEKTRFLVFAQLAGNELLFAPSLSLRNGKRRSEKHMTLFSLSTSIGLLLGYSGQPQGLASSGLNKSPPNGGGHCTRSSTAAPSVPPSVDVSAFGLHNTQSNTLQSPAPPASFPPLLRSLRRPAPLATQAHIAGGSALHPRRLCLLCVSGTGGGRQEETADWRTRL